MTTALEAARFEVQATIVSATGLRNVNWRHGGELTPYAAVHVDPAATYTTRPDYAGGTSPSWRDQPLRIPFSSPVEESTLHIDINHHLPAEGIQPRVGSARTDLHRLVREIGYGNRATRTLQISRPSGRVEGEVVIEVGVRELGVMEADFAM